MRRKSGTAAEPQPTNPPFVIHVQPGARHTEVAGRHGDAIKIRVAAPPVGGAANDELTRFLAERLGVTQSAVTIVAGASGRRKRVRVSGMGPEEIEQRLRMGDDRR